MILPLSPLQRFIPTHPSSTRLALLGRLDLHFATPSRTRRNLPTISLRKARATECSTALPRALVKHSRGSESDLRGVEKIQPSRRRVQDGRTSTAWAFLRVRTNTNARGLCSFISSPGSASTRTMPPPVSQHSLIRRSLTTTTFGKLRNREGPPSASSSENVEPARSSDTHDSFDRPRHDHQPPPPKRNRIFDRHLRSVTATSFGTLGQYVVFSAHIERS